MILHDPSIGLQMHWRCRQNEVENPELAAWVKSSITEEFLKQVKQAWRFSRDKRRFEAISTTGIDCVSEGGS